MTARARRVCRTLLIALVIGGGALGAARQQPPPRFRSGVEAVVLDVSVLDKDRHPVRGLTAADFTILEDGVPQTLETFKAVDLEDVVESLSAPWVREVAPDVRRNDEFKNHRVVVIVLDSSSPAGAEDVLLARRLGRTVIDQLPPDDVAAVVYTLNKDAGQVFTKDRGKLRAAVDRYNTTFGRPSDAYDPTAETLYRSVVSTLRGTAEWMAELPDGRKAIIFISVGIPLDVELASQAKQSEDMDVGDQIRSLYRELAAIIEAAGRANVSFYAADPGGLRTVRSPKSHDFLKTLSNMTAGFAVVDTNNPAPDVAQIYRENGSYYLLGYQPKSPRTEGRFRKIEVRVNRPGMTVRARSGYVEPSAAKPERVRAPKPAPSPLTAALSGVLPATNLALQVAAAPFARQGSRQADVAIAADVSGLVHSSSTTSDEVDVVAHAYDMGARLRASDRVKVRLTLRPGAASGAHFGVLSRLVLEPGRYQLRLAAGSSSLGLTGSVYADLEVPDFVKAELSLSGVVLDVAPEDLLAARGKLSAVVPVVPTARREFAAGEQASAFVRVYQGGRSPLAPVVVSARVVDGQDAEVFSTAETVERDRFGTTRAANFQVSLPIARLAKGAYLLTITATRGSTTVKRDVRFTRR